MSCVFNVKKRSWKGGVQVAVHMMQGQIERLGEEIHFSHWLARVLAALPSEDHLSYQERAHEFLIQALCWCKLDLLLRSAIMQENQCLAEDIWIDECRERVAERRDFILSYIAAELDLVPGDVPAP
ncbi:MAG: hypothetical protein OEV08_00220 [Nitrospira sp.]|nr:hypothetical protein [Nitrospira sp.]